MYNIRSKIVSKFVEKLFVQNNVNKYTYNFKTYFVYNIVFCCLNMFKLNIQTMIKELLRFLNST